MAPRKTNLSKSTKATTKSKRRRASSASSDHDANLKDFSPHKKPRTVTSDQTDQARQADSEDGSATRDEEPKQEDSEANEELAESMTKEHAQLTIIKRGFVPVDPLSGRVDTHLVYKDKSGAWDALLTQTDISGYENKNNFYILQLLHRADSKKEYYVFSRSGRIGSNGRAMIDGPWVLSSAMNLFKDQYRKKTGSDWSRRTKQAYAPTAFGISKYMYIDREYGNNLEPNHTIDSTAHSTLEPEIQGLGRYLFTASILKSSTSVIVYDAQKLPFGLPTKLRLESASKILHKLGKMLREPSEKKSSKSYVEAQNTLDLALSRIIPHNFGSQRPPAIDDEALLKKEADFILRLKNELEDADSAPTSKLASVKTLVDGPNCSINPLDINFATLGLTSLKPVASDSKEFSGLEKYIRDTYVTVKGQATASITNAFRVERASETEAWNNRGYNQLAKEQRLLLCHGTRTSNFAALLRDGLCTEYPEAMRPHDEIYFGDMISQAIKRCYVKESSGIIITLLCDVVAKPFHKPTDWAPFLLLRATGLECKRKGKMSAIIGGRIQASRWKDAGEALDNDELKGCKMPEGPGKSVIYNEKHPKYTQYAVFDPSQIRIKYVLMMKLRE